MCTYYVPTSWFFTTWLLVSCVCAMIGLLVFLILFFTPDKRVKVRRVVVLQRLKSVLRYKPTTIKGASSTRAPPAPPAPPAAPSPVTANGGLTLT